MSAPGIDPDEVWMARAIALAERARGRTAPNPAVGCVVVADGVLVGEGWTQPPGGPHAEVVALADAGERARGATAHVTLEPCAHTGRTPPCVDALVAAGVARVVVGTRDPHGVAAGGVDLLLQRGVAVRVGVLDPWIRRQLAAFLVTATSARPHVTLKLAQTVDGALTAPAGRWVTGPASRRAVHRLRARVGGVLVGSGTVVVDDPRLDVRLVTPPPVPPRAVVLDGRGRTPAGAAVARPGTVVVTSRGSARWEDELTARGVQVLHVAPGPDGHGVDLAAAMHALWEEVGLEDLLAEPGATLATALMEADLVDRVVCHVATSVQGGDGRARIVAPVAASARWPRARQVRRGDDLEVVTDRPDS